jgi:hypothetical protein
MVFHIIDIIIVFICCISAVGLFGVITEVPSYFLKNPEIVISITNYNNTFIPPIFSFATFKTTFCLTNNINTNNIICNDYINCPSKMEAGQIYILYCSCNLLSCSFEEKKFIQETVTFWVLIGFLIIFCVTVIYSIFRCIFSEYCKKN